MSASSFLALPKPDIRNGFSFCKEHLTTVLPVVLATAAGTYLICRYFGRRSCKKSRVNREVNKDSPKVVHSFDMEDIGSKAVYCRCWRSTKFPYCDGAHTKHNEDTGDNVGPLIIKKRDA
ncbi:CDGSH iron-sulfur domain-containing protein 1 [Brienomyrus brachyistius]|uniref:CDGSH iron-sulfur domain-containing protein 1 n=1 Tax=Brienomyrus brachyistius TaxID=42636 RepID=UPI0020B18922|nr:CDGSH iron-sulfur domain-containing protein 1 [Brienomyrus brachyistius]